MADFFTAGQIALLSATTVRLDVLVKFEFVSSTIRVWNGNTELVVGGNTYLPMHGYARISGIGLSGQAVSEAVTMSLNGLPDQAADLLAVALAETPDADQQMVTIYIQLFTDDWQPSGIPIPLFRGFMQPPSVSRAAMQGTDGGTQSVSMKAENIFYTRSRPPFGRYTDRDQQARSPGDNFFGFVSELLNKSLRYPDFVFLASAGLSSWFSLSGADGLCQCIV